MRAGKVMDFSVKLLAPELSKIGLKLHPSKKASSGPTSTQSKFHEPGFSGDLIDNPLRRGIALGNETGSRDCFASVYPS